MAWQDELMPMLRVLINDPRLTDNDQTCEFSEDRLEELMIVAAKLVNQELSFDTTYTISISAGTISPDPAVGTTAESAAFSNLWVLRAACIVDTGTLRTKAASAGILAKCGPVRLDTLRHLDGYKTLINIGPCASYQEMKDNWMFGNGNICKAILSPFISNDFDPQNLSGNGGYGGYGDYCRSQFS